MVSKEMQLGQESYCPSCIFLKMVAKLNNEFNVGMSIYAQHAECHQ